MGERGWTSSDGKIHNQIYHILIDRRWLSNILHVWSFRGTDCDTDHCLMVAKGRKRLAVSKQVAMKFYIERYNFGKLINLEVRKQNQITISNRFAALENLSDGDDINTVWENIKWNIRTSTKDNLCLYTFKQHKPWFYEEFLRFLDQRKHAKMQLLQDPNKNNEQCR